MRTLTCLALLLIGCGYGLMLLRCRPSGPASPTQPEVTGQSRTVPPPDAPDGSPWQAKGTTRPAPGRRGIIAPVPLHPVIEVNVKPGDRVKKGQGLVKLDDDEPQAEVRAKKAVLNELKASLAKVKAQPREEERAEARAALESARVSVGEYREAFKRLDILMQTGSTSYAVYRATHAALLRCEADVLAAEARLQRLLKQPVAQEVAEAEARVAAAQANLESSQAELEHYTVTAPIDGVVSWLDVHVGTVSRPGTTVWGEILDLSEMDVQCDLTPSQAARVGAGDRVVVRQGGGSEARWEGAVACVGVAANPQDGRVPVRVQVTNPGRRLRCHTEVVVTFGDKERPRGRDK